MEDEPSAFSPFIRKSGSNKNKTFSFSPLDPGTSTKIFDSLKRMKEDMSPSFSKRKRIERNAESTTESSENELYALIESQRENLEDLEKEKEDLQNELDQKDDQIRDLELRLEESQEKEQQLLTQQVSYERDLKKTQLLLEEERSKVETLKAQLHSLSKSSSSTDTQIQQQREEFLSYRKKADEEIASLREKNRKLENTIEEHKDSLDKFASEIEKSRFNHQREKEELLFQINSLEKKVQSETVKQSPSDDSQNNIQIMEQQLAEADKKIKSYIRLENDYNELKTLYDHIKGELNHYKSMESTFQKTTNENAFYKQLQQNLELLQEKNEGLKQKLERAQQYQEKYQQILLEKEKLEEKNNKFNSLISGLQEFESPAHIQAVIDELRRDKSVLLEKQGANELTLKQQTISFEETKSKLVNVEQKCEELQQKVDQLQENCKVQEKRSIFFKKKADGLQAILDSYNEETTSNYDKQKDDRIAELEKIAVEREDLLNLLQSKISLQPSETEKKMEESLEIRTLKTENSKLNKEIEKLVEEIAILESRVGRGEYDKKTTKVLHMSWNPQTKALAEKQSSDFESIQAENVKLKQELNQLRETSKSESGGNNEEIREDLQKQIEESQKKMNRLKEVFRKKIHEHREMVYQLFGYKIDNPADKQYRLQSMYAETDNDFLLFQASPDGSLNLLETEFTAKLGKEITAFLTKCHSIPAFLSNITMELFNNQTFHP